MTCLAGVYLPARFCMPKLIINMNNAWIVCVKHGSTLCAVPSMDCSNPCFVPNIYMCTRELGHYFGAGDMFLPPSTKWGSSKHRPIHCFLYSNALVVIAAEKKTKYQSQVT